MIDFLFLFLYVKVIGMDYRGLVFMVLEIEVRIVYKI